MPQKIYSSSLSRQSSETKPSTKLVLVSQEPLLYLEFNKINLLIYLKNSTFLSLKITVDTLIDVRNETSKHHFLNSSWGTNQQKRVGYVIHGQPCMSTKHKIVHKPENSHCQPDWPNEMEQYNRTRWECLENNFHLPKKRLQGTKIERIPVQINSEDCSDQKGTSSIWY